MLLFLLKASFAIFILCFTSVITVHVASDITPQVGLYEAVHLFDGFIINSHVYLLWFSSD